MENQPVPVAASHTSDPRWSLIQRVLDSKGFQHCPKLRAFMLYVCENTLSGRMEDVCEQMIGSKVYGRLPNYNTSEDTIVRTEAWKLRKRLEAYFDGEGRNEPIVMEMPKGGYVPKFRPREQAAQEASAARPAEPADAAAPALGKGTGRGKLVPLLAGGLCIAVAAGVWLGVENWHLRRLGPPGSGAAAGASVKNSRFYNELLGNMGASPERETLLVLSNPKVVLYYGAGTDGPGPEASDNQTVLAPKELKARFGEALNNIDRQAPVQYLRFTREDYTGMGEAVASIHMDRLMRSLRRTVRLTQGRFLNWEQMAKQDVIILGAPQINDWTFHNAAGANFNQEFRRIVNAKPLPGEQKYYEVLREPTGSEGKDLTDFGVVKMITSPYGFRMLILFGMSSAGTAGVGEFVANPEKMKPVYDRLRAAAQGKPFPANWEVLMKIDVRDSLPVSTSPIAFRPQ